MKEEFKIKIEHGIPMIKQRNSVITESIKNMKVGDSFLYPADKRTHITGNANRLGFRIVTRKTEDGLVRVWRVK